MTNEIAACHPEVFESLEGNLNEVYLWHGTAVRTALSIAQNGFKIDLAGESRGTMYGAGSYGAGSYFAESRTKADEYATDEPNGYYRDVFALLLRRVCMVKLYYTSHRDEEAGERVAAGLFDSTCGDRVKSVQTSRELVVYDADQVYPEYVALYSRMTKGEGAAARQLSSIWSCLVVGVTHTSILVFSPSPISTLCAASCEACCSNLQPALLLPNVSSLPAG